MATISIQLHEAIDGTCFPSKQQADDHSKKLKNLAKEKLTIIINSVIDNDEYAQMIVDDIVKEKKNLRILFD